MKLNRFLQSFILALAINSFIFGQSIAFIFDDGPKVENGASMTPAERNTLLLQQFKEHGIKSALFIDLKDTHDSGLALARKWVENGHMIGSHTVSHVFFSSKKVTLKSFEQELLGCDSIIRNMPGYSKRFRFPYLNEDAWPFCQTYSPSSSQHHKRDVPGRYHSHVSGKGVATNRC